MLFGKRSRRNKQQNANQPSDGTHPDPILLSSWEAQNQDALEQLARFMDFAEGFTLGFVEISFSEDVGELVKALQKRPECKQVQFFILDAADPNLRYLKDVLANFVQQFPPPISILLPSKPVIVVQGLENSIGMFGDYPPILQDLNFVRDAFIESVPYPVLFCLPSYAINRVIRFAPDFWSWKSGTFRILSSDRTQDQASIRALHAQKLLGSLNQLERQERIHLLERLAQEFSSLEGHRPKDDLRVEVKALIEIGIIHAFSGEYPKAREALDKAAQVLEKTDWQPETQKDLILRIQYLNWYSFLDIETGKLEQAEANLQNALQFNQSIDAFEQGSSCTLLGRIRKYQGQIEEAIALYQQSLEIDECIGNVQGKAATLNNIGTLKADQGQIEEAIALYQQSLEIKERIGNLQGKAATLNDIGRLKADQGQIEEAIALYQQSLEIDECIGDVQNKAITLNNTGRLKADQGQIEEAIALYQQSLEIKERIGNVQGKAVTLRDLGNVKVQQSQLEDAMDLYQQSLSIMQHIGDPWGESRTLLYMGVAQYQLEQYPDALANYQKALAMFRELGDRPHEAEALKNLAEIHRALGNLEETRQYGEQALALAAELDIPLKAECQAFMVDLDISDTR